MNGKDDDLKDLIRRAYKKLKSFSYYENRNVFLKKRIVDFEKKYEYELDKKFEELEFIIESGNIEELIENNGPEKNFMIRILPKSIQHDDDAIISNSINENDYFIDKVMYYLDICIEAQIIGVLWIMLLGKDIEKTYDKNTAGNELEDNILRDNLSLFKPYYTQYSKWRDDAVNLVEKRMDDKKRTIMMSLDVKEYFYSTNIDFKNKFNDEIKAIIKKKNASYTRRKAYEKINNFIEKVIEKYSSEISKDKRNLLPIGFLPSPILCNWYLKDFDTEVIKKINPLYYKRYIDDIILVFNGDFIDYEDVKNDQLEGYLLNKLFCENGLFRPALMIGKEDDKEQDIENIYELNTQEDILKFIKKVKRENIHLKKSFLNEVIKILRKYDSSKKDLIKQIENKYDYIVYSDWKTDEQMRKILREICENKEVVTRFSKEGIDNVKLDNSDFKKIFLISSLLNKDDKNDSGAKVCIQDEKIRVYDFKGNGSKAIIDNFKKELLENASAFKFLPEKNQLIDSFDRNVYKISYKDNLSKLSNMERAKISRYEISKFLASIIYSDKLENSEDTKDVDEKILWIFKNPIAIEFYFLWNKVFIYYLLNKKYKYVKDIFSSIYLSIENLEVKQHKYNLNKLKTRREIKNLIRRDLREYLKIVLSMTYSINDELFLESLKCGQEGDSNKGGFSAEDSKIYNELIKDLIGKGINPKRTNIKGIFTLKEEFRRSNMFNHSIVHQPLMNYCYRKYDKDVPINYITNVGMLPDIKSDMRCFKINNNYYECFACINNIKCMDDADYEICKKCINKKFKKENKDIKKTRDDNQNSRKNDDECLVEITDFHKNFNPRYVHLHECILFYINQLMARGKIVSGEMEIKKGIELFKVINNFSEEFKDIESKFLNAINMPIQMEEGNSSGSEEDKVRNVDENEERKKKELFECTHLRYFNKNEYLFIQKDININYIEANQNRKDKFKIAIVNMNVEEDNLKKSFKKVPNLESSRLENLNKLLNYSVKNNADMIIFPEVSIPMQWLDVIAKFSENHDIAIVCGLEHVIYENGLCCNYIVTILPDQYKEYKYAVIKLRLKNHYSPNEKEWVQGYGWKEPQKEKNWKKEYDLFRWKGVDFSTFSCFELANIKDRSLFCSYVDLLIGSVHNKDVNYYSNVMESLSRDVHCYFAHVNYSRMGDNRIIKPASTNEKNILQISGGINDTVLIGEIDVASLREFQCLDYNLQIADKRFKPVPPEFNRNNVKVRCNLPL
ncbi:reverse transcriptase domain-containing protein [Clostridium beijerinckii]|uniref:Reverse transcriptase domain-containing protein n=1 Tax=Clostridium beijerinckii TaxID=1520 RepID=A0AAW3W3E8_CLOBE|nr:reverse transcriptase domain-containing protein [Clostridium beijerinckii]MBC2458464.1 hypothetical protein [Clostridium beijerinckii]MBC2473424.1 hypothetical protein [Clostridium beijerinckii]NOV60393.1 hypothetical protein [Clostridium beijerinckii]NOV70831.1 hypothetical protein [Clostridium beijerinckii]NOW33749.1 hypothetical protein [Clostridium beijerinckii]